MIAHLELLEGSSARMRRWLIAGFLMISMHAVAGALAMVSWPEDDTIDEEAGAFMVEMAPIAVSPAVEKLNVAIGLRAEEAAPSVAPMEEIKEKTDIEMPKVEEAPLAPEPEIVLQKEVPVEELDVKEVEEDPRPEQKATPQTSAAPSETTAPPPVDAPPAEKPAAPKQGISNKPSEASLTWHKSLVLHLNKHKKYPHEARKAGEEGVASVSFKLDRSGKVIASHLDKSTGSTLLDKEAIEVLARASPFPAPPSDVADVTISLTLPIQFRIKR
jgi:protein TonB